MALQANFAIIQMINLDSVYLRELNAQFSQETTFHIQTVDLRLFLDICRCTLLMSLFILWNIFQGNLKEIGIAGHLDAAYFLIREASACFPSVSLQL